MQTFADPSPVLPDASIARSLRSAPTADHPAKITVVVHGVGQQTRLQTLKSFIDGATAQFDIPNTQTRAELARQLEHQGYVSAPGLPSVFHEFNFARLIDRHLHLAEEDPKLWVRSCRNHLREINRRRGGPPHADFIEVENTVDDLMFAAKLGRFIAMRFHVQADSFAAPAMHFVRQVQLYLDYPPYRDGIAGRFRTTMENVVAQSPHGGRNITVVAHSLGTVVALRALLEAASSQHPWIDRVERFVTFGSPIDLLLILYPHLFTPVHTGPSHRIAWSNYTLGNDPIATDLSAARSWVAEHAAGVFVADAPEEIDLGKGSVLVAHTDYWHHDDMLREIVRPDPARDEDGAHDATSSSRKQAPRHRRRSNTTAFLTGSVATSALVAWLAMVWWEENTKEHDMFRHMLGGSLWQAGIWAAMAVMIFCHMQAWSTARVGRALAALGCIIFCWLAFLMLPPVSFAALASELPEVDPLSGAELRLRTASAVIFLVPLTAWIGAVSVWFPRRGALSKRLVGGLLVVLTLGLSLFVGTRQNVSNLSAEFGVLSLTLGLWWLGVLLGRIHHAFLRFVGGRDHLDALCRLWNVNVKKIGFRRT